MNILLNIENAKYIHAFSDTAFWPMTLRVELEAEPVFGTDIGGWVDFMFAAGHVMILNMSLRVVFLV